MDYTENQKNEIRDALSRYVRRYPSQKKAAASLRGVSEATLSVILAGKYENISSDMWSRLRSQVCSSMDGYTLAETSARAALCGYLKKMQDDSSVMWITGPAGVGKSTTAREYAENGFNVFLLLCTQDMSRPDFMKELAACVGIDNAGMSIRDTFQAVINHLITLDRPLIIFEEADKLKDNVLLYFITIYNELEDRCGIVFLSTDAIKRRFDTGIAYNKIGFNELFSRIARRFVPLRPATRQEVEEICRCNGIEDKNAVRSVVAEAAEALNDLRRVKRCISKQKEIEAYKKQKND